MFGAWAECNAHTARPSANTFCHEAHAPVQLVWTCAQSGSFLSSGPLLKHTIQTVVCRWGHEGAAQPAPRGAWVNTRRKTKSCRSGSLRSEATLNKKTKLFCEQSCGNAARRIREQREAHTVQGGASGISQRWQGHSNVYGESRRGRRSTDTCVKKWY